MPRLDLRSRLRAAGWHLLLSAAVAALAALLVFVLWYPGAYRRMAGGQGLFLLVTGVDLVLGPLLTFAVFDLRKGWSHLKRDLAVIVLLQLAALGYGLHTVYAVRPVALVLEVDRLRVVTAQDVHTPELPKAPEAYRSLPLAGPWLLGTRTSASAEERSDALMLGLQGIDKGQRPLFWTPYDDGARAQALAKARPVAQLQQKYPQHREDIDRTLREHRLDAATARFLPVLARGDWVALLDPAGVPVAFLPLDGFF